jgi:transposase
MEVVMSLKPSSTQAIPELTVRVAKAAFPKDDNIYMKMRDELGVIYEDEQFVDLFPRVGQPAEAPGRLALVTIMQFAESLTDRAAADAVRSRIDWKYALGLELEDAGFHYSVLSKFRKRLLIEGAEERLLNQMIDRLQTKGLLKAGGQQRTDSTHIIGAIRNLNRLVLVGETIRHALDTIAAVAPTWLQSIAPPVWYERYSRPWHEYKMPKEKTERETLACRICEDGLELLQAIYEDIDMIWLRKVPAVQILRQIWIQQFYHQEGILLWRANKDTPPFGKRIVSPFDIDARQGVKRDNHWLGYKVHLTETCDADAPKLITNVETRLAPESDTNATADVHEALADKGLLPKQHVVDTGYVAGHHIINSQETYGIDLLGPIQPDASWQAKDKTAFDTTSFTYDWQHEIAICPQSKRSIFWQERQENNHVVIDVMFSRKDCGICTARAQCTKSKVNARSLTIRPEKDFVAIQERRDYQKTTEFKEAYAIRAGVEGLMSQTAVAMGMRRSRYRGIDKTHLQHVATATAVNLKRTASWLLGYATAETRVTRFAALALAA